MVVEQPDRIPVPRADVEWAFLDGEAVLYDPRASEVHHLNASASAVWLLCDGSTTAGSIVSEIAEAFGISEGEAEPGVAESLARLTELKVLVADEPSMMWSPSTASFSIERDGIEYAADAYVLPEPEG